MTHTRRHAGLTANGEDVLGFHLHRYIAGWLVANDREAVHVTFGYEGSRFAPATFEVRHDSAERAAVPWRFDELVQSFRELDEHARLPVAVADDRPEAVVLLDPTFGASSANVVGFVVLDVDGLTTHAISALVDTTLEAIGAARRNGIRLLLDENRNTTTKTLLYRMLGELPFWLGCDVAGSVVLSDSAETMAMQSAERSQFTIMAAELYGTPKQGDERLVGMDVSGGIFASATAKQAADRWSIFHTFERTDAGYTADGTTYEPFHRLAPSESQVVLTRLVVSGESAELLGFLMLSFAGDRPMGHTQTEVMRLVADELTSVLRHSPLFALSAKRIWLLQSIRNLGEACVAQGTNDVFAATGGYIAAVVEFVRKHTAVPSFTIATIEDGTLHFRHAFGWDDDAEIEIPLHPDRSGDASVTALSVRFARPLVLAGGHQEGDQIAFKNYVLVNEASGEVVDARDPKAPTEANEDWSWLRDYYRPARSEAYATLAFPLRFAEGRLGVMAVEVDRDTRWSWWSGYGARLFWEMLASEVSFTLHALGAVGESD